MSDVGRYGVTQHADAEMITANQLVGERLDHPTVNAAVGASPAMSSTAPYKPPPAKPGAKGCYAKGGKCGAPAMKGERYCFWHNKNAVT